MSKVAQAAQVSIGEISRLGAHTYASYGRELIPTTANRDISPQVWLEKLSACAAADLAATTLRGGTYVVRAWKKNARCFKVS